MVVIVIAYCNAENSTKIASLDSLCLSVDDRGCTVLISYSIYVFATNTHAYIAYHISLNKSLGIYLLPYIVNPGCFNKSDLALYALHSNLENSCI